MAYRKLVIAGGNLKMDDPATVAQELSSVATKWEEIARELGAEATILDAIRGESCEDGDEGCLQGVARWWLGREDVKPQWGALVEALRSETVKELELAKELETKYCSKHTVEESEQAAEQPAAEEEGGEIQQDTEESEQAADQPVTEQEGGELQQETEESEQAADRPVTEQGGELQQDTEEPEQAAEQPATEQRSQSQLENGEPPQDSTESQTPSIPAPPTHIYNPGWSRLPKDVLVDKVKGIIYGQAIGDAFGLSTEFMSRKMAQKVYGKMGPSSYSEIAQDFHRMRWNPGDWTDDTDQMLLILQMIVENDGKVDRVDFAKRLYHWMQHGYEELGDIGGMGIGMTVHRTLCHNLFLKDPHAAARHVWESSGRYLAANGAIMRTSVLGILDFNDVNKVVANSKDISQCTHADPRCTASCIAVTTALALILQGSFDPMESSQVASLIDFVLMHADKVLEHEDQRKEIRDHIKASSLEKLKLDDEKRIGYTFKALGAGFYGLRNAKDFRQTITDVIMQAGDADSNASVCGALMGCKFGFQALPQDLLQFPHRQWLDAQVNTFLRTIGLQD